MKALEAPELKLEEAIAVGDFPTGMDDARNAGVKVYALRQQTQNMAHPTSGLIGRK